MHDLVLFKVFRNKPSAAALAALKRARARQSSKVLVDPSTLRRPGRPEDRTPMAFTVRWANEFPRDRQPNLLLERYPHVANRLALCWADKALAERLFEDLLVDKRGGRKGFPSAVRAELLHLHWELHAQVPTGTRLARRG